MEERFIDNFSIFIDTNPDCPENEKFKALSLESYQGEERYVTDLMLYTSVDGLKFENPRKLDIKGVFDTYNVLIWDDAEKMYRIYLRDFHKMNRIPREYYTPTVYAEELAAVRRGDIPPRKRLF